MKQRVILNIAALLELGQTEREELANKAGLSFLFGEPNAYTITFFQKLDCFSNVQLRMAQSVAGISERMFEYIRVGRLPSKESALSLAIALGFSIDGVRNLIGHAGYCLSRSLPRDMVITWFMTNCEGWDTSRLVSDINMQLEECGLPLLMTRQLVDKNIARSQFISGQAHGSGLC